MDAMIALCGLNGATCPIHLATVEPDRPKQRALRIDIARTCSEQYGLTLLPEGVTDCDGCVSHTGVLFWGCSRCEIRKCAIERSVSSCAFCVDYACHRLRKHFEGDPDARTRLETMRVKSQAPVKPSE